MYKILVQILIQSLVVFFCLHIAEAKLNNEKFSIPNDDPSYSFFNEVKTVFQSLNYNFKPDPKSLSLQWPLLDSKLSTFDKFETSEVGEYIDENGNKAYWTVAHQAIDIIRSSTAVSEDVFAPVSGYAVVTCDRFDGADCKDIAEAYRHSISIYDPKSHLIVGLLHVGPLPGLKAATHPVWVNKGEKLGTLGEVISAKPAYRDSFRHVHLFVMDISEKSTRFINPLPHFELYRDSVKPVVKGFYLLNEHGNKSAAINGAELDVVVDAYDLDGTSLIQMPIYKLDYRITDDQNRVLREVKNCKTDEMLDSLSDKNVIRSLTHLFDLTETLNDISPDYWMDGSINVGVTNRSFRYVLTNLKNLGWNKCGLVPDNEGSVKIPTSTNWIEITVKITDHNGNSEKRSAKLIR